MLFKCCVVSIQFFRGLTRFLYHLYPSVQLVLAVCYRPFVERARAISVFCPL